MAAFGSPTLKMTKLLCGTYSYPEGKFSRCKYLTETASCDDSPRLVGTLPLLFSLHRGLNWKLLKLALDRTWCGRGMKGIASLE